MHLALQRLAALPEQTTVHCAHEYTESNLRWAASLKPEDERIQARLASVTALRQRGTSSLPSTVALEKATNLFVQASNAEEVSSLRQHKDHWRG